MSDTDPTGTGSARSDAGFRRVVAASPMGAHLYRLEGDDRLVFVGANPAADRLLGVDNSQFVGKTIEEAFPPLADTEVPRRYREAARDGVAWKTEQIAYQDDQIQGAFEVHAFQTGTNEMAAFFLDITERKRAELEQRKLIQVIENSQNFVGLATLDGTVVFVNAAGREMVGLKSLDEARATNMIDYIDEEERDRLATEIIPAALSGGVAEGEGHMRRFDNGELIDVAFTTFLVRDEDNGNATNLAMMARDLRERNQAEEERAKLEAQLLHSQKMEAVGRLAGGIAHDFNNLLTGIIGYSELALVSLDKADPLHRDLDSIRRAAERAASLTQQLLAFSRKQLIAPKVIRPHAEIEQSADMLRRIIGEDVKLIFSSESDLWRVKVDPGQLDQVLVNLATNARDAMPDGGTLTVETANVTIDEAFVAVHPEAQIGEHVMLAVSDTGTGMPPEVRAHIFEPFYSTKPHGKGTGLGLSTVYGIVQQHQGFVHVYSEPDCGTSFRIYLPRATGRLRRPTPLRRPTNHEGDEIILLVEDDEVVRTLTKRILTRLGHTVVVAADGPSAELAVASNPKPIQLLLTDVVMPNMSGRELYQRLQAAAPELRVLYMSGYTEDAIAHHGVLDEGIDFIPKPFTVDALARKVRAVLDR